MAQHHIYSPIGWQSSLSVSCDDVIVWGGKKKGKPRCKEAVHTPPVGFAQCVRVGTVQEAVTDKDGKTETYWFCKQHSLAQQIERRRVSDEKYARQRAIDQARWSLQRNAPKFRAALEAIAAGHNDARGLAAEVLQEADA